MFHQALAHEPASGCGTTLWTHLSVLERLKALTELNNAWVPTARALTWLASTVEIIMVRKLRE